MAATFQFSMEFARIFRNQPESFDFQGSRNIRNSNGFGAFGLSEGPSVGLISGTFQVVNNIFKKYELFPILKTWISAGSDHRPRSPPGGVGTPAMAVVRAL